MSSSVYTEQVSLLLDLLSEIAKEDCFALHGGTAINFFIRDMPRLSVDIDLTYIAVEERETSLRKITEALVRIENNIQSSITIDQLISKPDTKKIYIRKDSVEVKIEVNFIMRGVMSTPITMNLCQNAMEKFDKSVTMPIVPFGQLYGGKICAALDRQHPRDLFDVKLLLENEGFTDEVREGFLLCLISSDRPINEILVPNYLDQRNLLDNQFSGMSNIPFTYDDFEQTRDKLFQAVFSSLTDKDKEFLLSIKDCNPDWSVYNFERFSAVQWKLQNLQKLKDNNSKKHRQLYDTLQRKLYQ